MPINIMDIDPELNNELIIDYVIGDRPYVVTISTDEAHISTIQFDNWVTRFNESFANIESIIKKRGIDSISFNVPMVYKGYSYIIKCNIEAKLVEIPNEVIESKLSIDNVVAFEQSIVANRKKKPNVKSK